MGDGSRALACWHIGPLVLALLVLSYLLRRQDFVELGQQLAAGEVQWKAPSIALSLSKLAMASSPSLLDTDNSSLAYQAIKFVQSRRTAHIDAGFNYAHWRLRGVGYLLEQHGMVLAAEVPSNATAIVGEKAFIYIRDVNIHTKDKKKKWTAEECSKFFIWVRVRSGEIFAGQASTADATTIASAGHMCVWRYAFQPSVSGMYHVDAKIIHYNGNQPHTHDMKCAGNNTDTEAGRAGLQNILDQYPLHAGWKGFKLYSPAVACCEICTRMAGCRAWSSPPFNIAPSAVSHVNNGCELYYDQSTPMDIIPRSCPAPIDLSGVQYCDVSDRAFWGYW